MTAQTKDRDYDIKISPDEADRRAVEKEKASEAQIELFLRQRDIGNMEKASKLGCRFIDELLGIKAGGTDCAPDKAVFEHQKQLLFCYIVHRITQDNSPNSIVAQKTLASFYEGLEKHKREIFQAMNGNMSFSMYLYLNRQKEETPQNVGEVFAKLCEVPENSECSLFGKEFYVKYSELCRKMVVEAGYN